MLKVTVPWAALSPWTVSESSTDVLTDTQILTTACVLGNTFSHQGTMPGIETKDSTLVFHHWIINYDHLLLLHLAHPDLRVVHYSLLTGQLSKAVWGLFSQRDGYAVWHTDVALSETYGLARSRLSGSRVFLTDCCPCFTYYFFLFSDFGNQWKNISWFSASTDRAHEHNPTSHRQSSYQTRP